MGTTRALLSWRLFVCLTFCASLIACGAQTPSLGVMTHNARVLRGLFQTLESHRVWGWMDRPWCQLIEYETEAFASALETATCSQRLTPTSATAASRQDWAVIDSVVSSSGVPVFEIGQIQFVQGLIAHAEFSVDGPETWSWTYVFHTESTPTTDDSGPGIVIIPIDGNWYFRSEDAL